MKIFLGILIGAGLMFGCAVFAQNAHGIINVQGGSYPTLDKWYDQDNGVVCYTVGSYRGGISCLHN